MSEDVSSLIREPEGVDFVIAEGHPDRATVLEIAEWLAKYRRQHDHPEDVERALSIIRRNSEQARSSPRDAM